MELHADEVAVWAFQAASYCTEPVCKAHELYRRIAVVDALYPEADAIYNLGRQVLLGAELAGWAVLAALTTAVGIAFRAIGAQLQAQPFIYIKGESEAKTLPSQPSFSLLSWNICCVAGGYPISDGGVMPWISRIDRVANKIIEKQADVNCLYETFDAESGFYLAKKLKQQGYGHIYFNIGPRAVGVNSGILIASKYAIQNPEFSLFPQEALVGRTKNAAKGVFAFDLASQGRAFARIHATHLQHSEEPEFPTQEEVEARRLEMQLIVDKVNAVRDRCIVVTGDLNLDDHEYEAYPWKDLFQKGDAFSQDEKTWGGDAFCANMTGKRASGPLNLDHTMVLAGTAQSLHTTLVKTGYDPLSFKEGALSDHEGLFSLITV